MPLSIDRRPTIHPNNNQYSDISGNVRVHGTAKDSFRLIYKRYFKYMAHCRSSRWYGTTLLAGQIITLIFGVAYGNSAIALQILIWATFSYFLTAAFLRLLRLQTDK
jgi:hypothetical protein